MLVERVAMRDDEEQQCAHLEDKKKASLVTQQEWKDQVNCFDHSS